MDPALAHLGVRDDDHLRTLIARTLEADGVHAAITSWTLRVSPVAYDLEALTTLSRQRVHGHVETAAGSRPFSVFVKVLRSWRWRPEFAFVPPPLRADAERLLPWEVEPAVYRTALAAALPTGLSMPSTVAVIELGGDAAAVWMTDVATDPSPWSPARFEQAARLLGRLAVSPDVVAALRPIEPLVRRRTVRSYLDGRVRHQVLPALRDEGLWQHPSVGEHFGPLRSELVRLADRLPSLVDELDRYRSGVAHGDACTRNLLVTRDGGLCLIDFGFVALAPVGFDLSQLTVGEHQLGERDPADLPEISDRVLDGYAAGLAAEGVQTPDRHQLRRVRAVVLALFSGISAVPFERLGDGDGEEVDRIVAGRAVVCRWILDEVAATEGRAVR
ncbi:hypothetical protein FHX74_003070 [Friedmanniella endophytica]|uniref:Aminoglycoside phosphotransferase domain-containing protein n=1 Tax=Microlunatus kandeliicorticis TaxID=1759536 RepID=A0A7W3P6X3_9ACTN|nr:phosphotransferase [Microlunatus kandeliicorticis]MBA8795434.1 hypothetical protein [Microlunatus kandeliicorticis]